MIPGLTCADCERPMSLSRTTDYGYIHAPRCPRACAVEGCQTPRTKSATWCEPHTKNNRRWGNPLGRPSMEIEDIEWMAETGETLEGAAHRLQRSSQAIAKHLDRAGRQDVYARLLENQRRRQGVAA